MQARRPTRRERIIMLRWGLNPLAWMVEKRPRGELHLVHKHVPGERRVVKVVA